ncbi:MAG TPA: sigma-70 family RNA polymerase sigma factor [Gemmataceae bacterium]|jgi:RNA polymerase sigma factor (sigma-70 family)
MARRLFLQLLAAARTLGEPVADAELLRRFVSTRDSAAFELLLHRHAGAVWQACRRILRNETDAEDAFQAAFLVLVKKAGSIRGTCIGGWLHRVAVNAALKLKSGRKQHGIPLDRAEHPVDAAEEREIAARVQEELARLPERYRLPVVLCDLEGHTHAEAAALLNWPIGSVSGRLSRAHALLRDRLTRRGLVAPAVLLTTLVPPASAIHSALANAIGAAPVAPSVSILAQGVLAAMQTAKLKLAATIAASLGLIAMAGVGTVAAWAGTQPEAVAAREPTTAAAPVPKLPPENPLEGDWLNRKATPPTAFPELKGIDWAEFKNRDLLDVLAKVCPRLWAKDAIKIEATDDTYRRLLKASLYQATQEIWMAMLRIQNGSFQPVEYIGFLGSLEKMEATTLEIWSKEPNELIPRLKEFVVLAKHFEHFSQARTDAGTDPTQNLHEAHRHRLATEAVLWKALHPPATKK